MGVRITVRTFCGLWVCCTKKWSGLVSYFNLRNGLLWCAVDGPNPTNIFFGLGQTGNIKLLPIFDSVVGSSMILENWGFNLDEPDSNFWFRRSRPGSSKHQFDCKLNI